MNRHLMFARRRALALVLFIAVVLTVAATVAAVLARWVTRPLDRLEQAADAVGSGNLAARAPAEGPPCGAEPMTIAAMQWPSAQILAQIHARILADREIYYRVRLAVL